MDESRGGYGGNFMSHDSQSYEFCDEEFGSQRISLSPKSNHQEGNAGSSSSEAIPPLGLRLRKTDSFLSMLEMSLSKSQAKVDEKHKASNFPASYIKIGTWQRWSKHEGDFTAKLYYSKQKLVWEFLDGALKSKMEIQWSDIIGIRATTSDNQLGALEIEVRQPPSFYRETNPQPRKHTLWQSASDFTGGQAPIYRRHYVLFPPGILDRHYQKLLQCDKRLLGLSQKPFPTLDSPYFDPTMFGIQELSRRFHSPLQYPHHYYPNPSMSIPFTNHHILTHPPIHNWNQGPSSHVNQPPNYYQPNTGLVNNLDHNLDGFNVNHSGRACDYGFGVGGNQVLQNGAYSLPVQHANNNNNNSWAPPQDHSNATNSFPSSFFGDPTNGDHY